MIVFFEAAQHAYEAGDLATLKGLLAATEYLENKEPDELSAIELQAEIVLLEASLESLKDKLKELRSSHPNTLKNKLASKSWIAREVEKLKNQTEEQNQAKEAFIEEYMKVVSSNE